MFKYLIMIIFLIGCEQEIRYKAPVQVCQDACISGGTTMLYYKDENNECKCFYIEKKYIDARGIEQTQ